MKRGQVQSDEQWAVIEPHLLKNQPSVRRVNDGTVISGIIHVLKVGCRWCPSSGFLGAIAA